MPKNSKSKVITKKQFDRWSPSHQQRALADVRTRSRIETRALPQEYRDRREAAIRNRTPITPGSSTTYGDLAKQRKYMETLTFGEGDRQLADRYQNLSDARARDADWFSQYRNDVAAAQDKAIQAQKDAVTGNQAFINSANAVSESSRNAIQDQLRNRAAQLGQTDQSAEYGQLADQAASARATLLAAGAQKQVNDANTNVNMRTEAIGTARLKDLEAQGYRNRQGSALEKDTRDYVSKRAAWREKFITDAISEARKQVLEDKAYNLKALDTAADNERQARNEAWKRKQDRIANKNARDRLALDRWKAQNPSKGSSGGGSKGGTKPATMVQSREAKSSIAMALSWVAKLRKAGWDQQRLRAGLIQGINIPQSKDKDGNKVAGLRVKAMDKDAVNTALDIAYRGFIGPANYRIWRDFGYNVGSWGWKVKKHGR